MWVFVIFYALALVPVKGCYQGSRKIALLIKRFIYEGRFMILSRRQQVL